MPDNGIVLVQGQIDASFQDGKLSIPKKFNLNNALIVGLRTTSKSLRLQFKIPDSPKMTATWVKNSGWTIDKDLVGEGKHRIMQQDELGVKCCNCGQSHHTEKCRQPYYFSNCRGCLVVSLDGKNHEFPCLPINKISPTRSSISSEEAFTLFTIVNSLSDVDMFFMDGGIFRAFEAGTILLSPPAGTVIVARRLNDQQCIELKQTSLKRCNILIAVLDKNREWRLRFRLVVTVADGLLVFPMSGVLQVKDGKISTPKEYNTIAIFGMKPKNNTFYTEVRVFANENEHTRGVCASNGYNIYFGVDVSSRPGHFQIDQGSNSQRKKKFNAKLYKPEPVPLSNFKRQRRLVQ